jgi:tetratricopeptide (TPR) repeat protein
VIKDLGADSFYRGQGLRDRIAAVVNDDRSAEVLYLGDDLPDETLPSLYTACDCLVHPYRGEGFGLPIAEAMACARAVVVPGYGPALEFCDAQSAYLVPAAEVVMPHRRIGDLETVDFPSYCEIDRTALALTLRAIAASPHEARARGAAARQRALTLTWAGAAQAARERLHAIAARPPRRLQSRAVRRRTLTACLVVRNEEQRIAAAINSVRGIADQIVVVDTGSTDGTLAIARNLGARTLTEAWIDDWSAARNAAIAQATGDWILFIDADQRLDEHSGAEVTRIIQHDHPAGFLLRQLNYLSDASPANAIEHLTVRLFRNHPAIRYRGAIHEQVVSIDRDFPLTLELCGVVLHHYGYESAATRLQKARRDLPMLDRAIAADPANAFHHYNLGIAYHTLQRYDEAGRALGHAVALAEAASTLAGFVDTAEVVLAAIALEQGRVEDAAAACRRVLSRSPGAAEAWCTLGACALRLADAGAARAAYRAALGTSAEPRLSVIDHGASGWKAWSGLARAELLLKQWDAALVCLEKASALNRDAAAPLLDEAARALQRAVELNSADAAALSALARVLRAMGAHDEADQAAEAARLWRARQGTNAIQLKGNA